MFWLFGLVPHPGLKYLGLILFGVVGVRLIVNPEVLRYEPRGAPIVNWLLYTYGVPVLATFAGAWLLRRAEAQRGDDPEYDWTVGRSHVDRAASSAALGLVLLFVLINVEIADYFSQGALSGRSTRRRVSSATSPTRSPGASTACCCSASASGAASRGCASPRWSS